ncbi:hypothetical protein EXIGLDRAFT_727292 [Exidia glandulosa HHB12029]|uniref:F-box domain-containing protein n=1 Tax=Exidia glandulosa HHB12029 TaxID=1314781 RepID=A0A165DEM0_EXIGL|nr:hypothetical protein EXIGLDRAFT_727292 [Exidia glandulosa HHB12029]
MAFSFSLMGRLPIHIVELIAWFAGLTVSQARTICLVHTSWLPLGRNMLFSDIIVLSQVERKKERLRLGPRYMSAGTFDRFVREVPHLLQFVRSLTLYDDGPIYTLWRTGAKLRSVRLLCFWNTNVDTARQLSRFLDAFDSLEELHVRNVHAGRFPGSYLAEYEGVITRKPVRPFNIRIIDWATEELCWWLYEHSGGSICETTIFNDHRAADMERTIRGLTAHTSTLQELTIRMTQLPISCTVDIGPTIRFLRQCAALRVLRLPFIDAPTATPVMDALLKAQLRRIRYMFMSLEKCGHDDLFFRRLDEELSKWAGLQGVLLSLQHCTKCRLICTSSMPLLEARGILKVRYEHKGQAPEPPLLVESS